MSETNSEFIEYGRELFLKEAAPVLHALSCHHCGLEEEAALALLLVGWEPQDFVAALLQRMAGGA